MAQPGNSFDGDDFLLPDLGEGLEEAEIVEWLIEVGQSVDDGDVLATVETGKAQTEVYAPRAGTIAKLHGGPGDTIPVGKPFVAYGEAAAEAADSEEAQEKPAAAEVGDVFADESDAEDEAEQPREDAGTVVGNVQAVAADEGKPLATPAVRRLARDSGVELADVPGTGIGGRITEADVRNAAGTSKPTNGRHVAPREEPPPRYTPPPQPKPSGETTTIPFRGTRRTIANRLRHSVDTAVHFTVMDEADATRLDATRKKLAAAAGEKVSLLPFVCLAVARVLSGEFGVELRRLNATVDDDAGEIKQHGTVHLGLAVDTPGGLMVPALRDTLQHGVLQLGRRIGDLAAACRDRSVPSGDLQGSTFTVSNFGSYAGRFATPVLNYPEVGILAVGRAREGVVVKGGLMGVGKLLPLSLTCDHRAVDGGTATTALNAVIRLLEDPDRLMPESTAS